jgi:23S rRNA (cytosine1962-C5)-methyltransferase
VSSPAEVIPPLLGHIPAPSSRRIAVRVTPAAERALRQGHPWLFDRAIRQQSHEGDPGDLAVIFDRKGRFLAVGLYDPHSSLRVRILVHGEAASIDRDWFAAKLAAAAQLRAPLLQLVSPLTNGGSGDHPLTTGYRLVHGENDGLPGLVIDRYEGTAVLKLYTAAWMPHLRDVLAALTAVSRAERVILRLGRGMQRHPEGLYGLGDGQVLLGPPLEGPVLFWENGLRFEADPVHGQKTGFFLDQRDNRARVERLAAGKSVLNLFAYTGGFSVYAARGGARSVISVDTSAPALDAAKRNWARNRQFPGVAAAAHETVVEDAFEWLARMGKAGRRFDMVIVDPPAFAQEQAQVQQALLAYERLTRLSLGVLQPGGTLVQASCSSRVDADTFFATVHRAAARAGRRLRELERSGHPLDHPITFREGAYLKCLFAVAP